MKTLGIPRFLLSMCLVLGLYGAAHGAVPVGWEMVDVLDNRLSIALPKSARPVVNGDARPNRPGEQRLNHGFEFDVDAVPVEVIVTEMLARSSDAIGSIGQEYARRLLPEKIEKPAATLTTEKTNGVDVVIFSTASPVKGRDRFLVKSAILRRPDDLLMRLDFYVRDEVAVQSERVMEATNTIISSVEVGSRQLPAGKGVTLASGELTLDLLPGYVAMEEARWNGTLVNIMPIKRPGERRGTLSIYFGYDVRFCTPHSPAGSLRLFGRKGTWDDSASRNDWLQRDVCLLDPIAPYDAAQVKIRIQGPDKQTEKDLLTILKSVHSKRLH